MSIVAYRLAEAVGFVTFVPAFLCLLHLIEGTPMFSEFQIGACAGAAFVKLMDAAHAYWGRP